MRGIDLLRHLLLHLRHHKYLLHLHSQKEKFAKDLMVAVPKCGGKPDHNLPAGKGKTARGYVGVKLKPMPPVQNFVGDGKDENL